MTIAVTLPESAPGFGGANRRAEQGPITTDNTGSGPVHGGRNRLLSLVLGLLIAVSLALGGVTVMAAPARAADPKTPFSVAFATTAANGNFIWYNRSVQVGGGVWGDTGDYCAAVVFTAYSGYGGTGNRLARAARPGDGDYHCQATRFGYGFTLDASDVVGGIRSITVTLWQYDIMTGDYDSRTSMFNRP